MRLHRGWWRKKDAPLNCREVGQVLQGYLDGELDGRDAPAVQAHLDACVACGLEADTYARIKVALAQPMPEDVDPEAIERLRRFGAELSSDEG